MIAAAAFAPSKGPVVDVSEHLSQATSSLWLGLALLLLFFALRPELWRRLWFTRVDPRPAALMRIIFGGVVLWTLLDLLPTARLLFTDEGLWPTDAARKSYGGHLRLVWDPEHGLRSWADLLHAIWGRFSLFHLRSDPPFVFAIFGLTISALIALIVGFYTRISALLAWLLVNTIYTYSPIFYAGGDTVVRTFLFLGLFTAWGEAYSIDAWRRRKRAILGDASELPPLRKIAAWPLRLMMLQLAIIYCATGALKAGHTWFEGTALYYALCLDHFYRHPAQIPMVVLLQQLWILPIATWITKWWETLFPLALLGAGLQAFERERLAGTWIAAATWRRALSCVCLAGVIAVAASIAGLVTLYYYDPKLGPIALDPPALAILIQIVVIVVPAALVGLYLLIRRWPRAHAFTLRWVLGKRLWLGLGVIFHLGIDLLMNVGTFVQVMLAVYLVWLSGDELQRLWEHLGSRPLRAGEPGAPTPPKSRLGRLLSAPARRLRARTRRPVYVVLYRPDPPSIRRAALLRCWDLCGRLDYEADPTAMSERLHLRRPDGALLRGRDAAARLCRLFPGLWWLAPFTYIPGLRALAGALARRALAQR